VAIAKVTNATVVSTFYDGKAARVVEEYQARGETRKTYTVLWFQQPHNLTQGQAVTVSGPASVKIGKPYITGTGENREGKAELHINVTKFDPPASPNLGHVAETVSPVQQAWPDAAELGNAPF
jgi:hypothetical protein